MRFGNARSARRAAVLLLTAYALTRLLGAWLADHPERYGAGGTVVTGDVARYELLATALAHGGEPYSDVAIEYPPGALPFMLAPLLGDRVGVPFRAAFIGAMLCVDALGLLGVARLARRSGSLLGPWLWVALPALLGPIVLLRIDLVPAVATVWALEQVAARSWVGAGGWLGYATLVKLYPASLVPAAVSACNRRARMLGAAALVFAIPLIPFATSLPEVWDRVVGYHLGRGIQIESTWGVALLLASKAGRNVAVEYNFGAFHIDAAAAPALETIATGLSLGAVGLGTVLVRRVRDGPQQAIAAVWVATLATLLVVGSVFSPQYVVWLVALVAAWAALDDAAPRSVLLFAGLAAGLSQLVYPFLYTSLLLGGVEALAALAARNALVGAVVVSSVVALRRAA